MPRFGNREVHRFATDHLTIAELPVDDGIARTLADDHRMLVGDDHALGVPLDVLGHANDAMRVVPGKIGVDQVIADDPRFAAVRSRGAKHRGDERAQVGDGYAMRRLIGAHRVGAYQKARQSTLILASLTVFAHLVSSAF